MVDTSTTPSATTPPSLEYTIRPATPDDAAAILSLIHGLAEYEKAPQEVTNTVEQLQNDGWGKEPKFFAFVVQLNSSAQHNKSSPESTENSSNSSAAAEQAGIIGFALCFYAYSTWKGCCLYLEDLYVAPHYRKGGVGMALFRKIVEEAKLRKCYRVMWQALDWNTPALKFYEHLGALQCPEWLSLRFTTKEIDAFINRFGTYSQPKQG